MDIGAPDYRRAVVRIQHEATSGCLFDGAAGHGVRINRDSH